MEVKHLNALLSACFLFFCTCPFALANQTFESKCAGCHTIGGGASAGPDLAGTAAWETERLSQAVKSMEKNCGSLTDDEVSDLVTYLKNKAHSYADTPASKDAEASSKAIDSTKAAEAVQSGNANAGSQAGSNAVFETGSAANGERLFNGELALAEGGLSCIACHQVAGAGGTMGPDLTNIGEKMTATALNNACLKTPYKVMNSAYKDHPLQAQEALDISSYLLTVKGSRAGSDQSTTYGAITFSSLVLISIACGYRNRNQGTHGKLKRRS